MEKKKKNEKRSIIILSVSMLLALAVLVFALGNTALFAGFFGTGNENSGHSTSDGIGAVPSSSIVQSNYTAVPLPDEMRAMWISFLEWQERDISTEAALRSAAGEMFDECKDLGLNTVLVHVRAFSDALYKSEIYPWSHLITGTQGQDPGFDPLHIMIEEAHARGLRFEAFINPYRVIGVNNTPEKLADNSPAVQNPSWVKSAGETRWFDPGIPEVRQMVVAGVQEIVQNYEVDGIHFDDYFYPEGIDESYDADSFAQYGNGMGLVAWRTQNNNELVQQVYSAVKGINPSVVFGISPAGNNDNNLQKYYADVKTWMGQGGYIDYIMPQLYWGFDYRQPNGSDRFAFENILNEWLAFPRAAEIKFYAGLAPYRIAVGDGGANEQDEWQTGHNLADMISHLRTVEGCSGFALFRHDSLFNSSEELATQEIDALRKLLQQ